MYCRFEDGLNSRVKKVGKDTFQARRKYNTKEMLVAWKVGGAAGDVGEAGSSCCNRPIFSQPLTHECRTIKLWNDGFT